MRIRIHILTCAALLTAFTALTSCTQECTVKGRSDVYGMDGKMLYLRLSPQGIEKEYISVSPCLDSCKVLHGRFTFFGEVDSAQMALVTFNDQAIMPMVVESGLLEVKLGNGLQRVSGGPMNDRLYKFIRLRQRIDNELWETQQEGMRMLREGHDIQEVRKIIGKRTKKLEQDAERLETKFVKDNYNNILGPGYFMLLSSSFNTPLLTPQILEILDAAPPAFFADPYVRRFIQQTGYER